MNELSTAGVTISYAIESVSGVRPTSGYLKIPNIKASPSFSPAPTTHSVTDFSDLEWMRYIHILKDPAGAVSFEAHNNNEFLGSWFTLCNLALPARENGLACWFSMFIPGLGKDYYFSVTPSPLSMDPIEVNTPLVVSALVTPEQVEGWGSPATKPAVYITPIAYLVVETQLTFKPILDAGSITSAVSANENVVTADVSGSNVVLEYVGDGETAVTLTSTAPAGRSAGKTIILVRGEQP